MCDTPINSLYAGSGIPLRPLLQHPSLHSTHNLPGPRFPLPFDAASRSCANCRFTPFAHRDHAPPQVNPVSLRLYSAIQITSQGAPQLKPLHWPPPPTYATPISFFSLSSHPVHRLRTSPLNPIPSPSLHLLITSIVSKLDQVGTVPPQHTHAHPSSAGQPWNVPEPRETLFSNPSFHSP